MTENRVVLTKRHLLIKNLILVIVTALLLVAATYTWFTNSKKADAQGIGVTVQTPENLEISLDGVNYNNALYWESSSLNLLDVTGDGKTIIRPSLYQENGEAKPNLDGEWAAAQKNVEYISIDIYMRSLDRMNVFFASGSSIDPKASPIIWPAGTDTTTLNKSSYGDFSKDCIVGAARLAVVDSSDQVPFVWIPHPELYLDASGEQWTMTDTRTGGETYVHKYYDLLKAQHTGSNTICSAFDSAKNKYCFATDQKITELNGEPNSDGYYVSKVTINVWIEGCDTEARRALSGGNFDVNIKFNSSKIS